MAHNQTIQVDVSWREILILSDVALEVEAEEAFMPMSSPMPVGTMLVVTPIRNREVRVPARITQIQETGASTSQRGMRMVFEAAWEQLQEYADEGTSGDSKPESASFDEESVPAGPNLSQNSGEYIEIVTITSPETSPEAEDQDVKDSGLAPQASGEIQLDAGALGTDTEAPDKVIIDVTEVPVPQPEATSDEDDLEADLAEEEIETAVERPAGLRAAEDEDAEEDAEDEEGKKRKRRRGRGKRRKKKR